mgnify:FL=1
MHPGYIMGMSTITSKPPTCLETLARASVERGIGIGELERAAAVERVAPALVLNSQRYFDSADLDRLAQRISERRRTH